MRFQVTVFSTSEKKKEEALKTLGADHFIVSKNKEEMEVSTSIMHRCYGGASSAVK